MSLAERKFMKELDEMILNASEPQLKKIQELDIHVVDVNFPDWRGVGNVDVNVDIFRDGKRMLSETAKTDEHGRVHFIINNAKDGLYHAKILSLFSTNQQGQNIVWDSSQADGLEDITHTHPP